jgi:hypothetical protein
MMVIILYTHQGEAIMEPKNTIYCARSQGTNVCADIVMMSCDDGVVPEGVEVVAIAGMGTNADTVSVMRSAGSFNFFDKINGIEFRELVAMPRSKKFW